MTDRFGLAAHTLLRRARRRVAPAALLGVVVASGWAGAGCAARSTSSISKFVKPGEPATKIEAPESAPPATLREYARRLRAMQANARPRGDMLPRIESQNPRLRDALFRLSINETAANHREVAAAYRALGITDYAHRHFQKAVRLHPCDADAYEGLARLWRDWQMPDLALGDAYRAIHCKPHSAAAYNTLGTVFVALGQRENARSSFEFAMRLDPGAVFALNNLCYLAVEAGNAGSARDVCERTLKLEPRLAVARNNLAVAQALEGDIAGAERRFLEDPDEAVGYYNVGILRMSLGHYRDAAAAFSAAVARKPSFGDAARRVIQARRLAAQGEQ